ncbi:MAG: hypothetical protein HC852_01255 [Acaryochloridaceae cyanobacterium RU_4_10]|nr:hypothetical protein [Acaryochloridaceae cyanobacterium RU_4_10]
MTPVELNRKGFKALVDTLGYADAIRFIRQFDNGSGDYTKERHQWLDKLTLEDFWADIQQRQHKTDLE